MEKYIKSAYKPQLAHAHELTYPLGSCGRKPNYFLVCPLFLGSWPVPDRNALDEETDGKKDDRQIPQGKKGERQLL